MLESFLGGGLGGGGGLFGGGSASSSSGEIGHTYFGGATKKSLPLIGWIAAIILGIIYLRRK